MSIGTLTVYALAIAIGAIVFAAVLRLMWLALGAYRIHRAGPRPLLATKHRRQRRHLESARRARNQVERRPSDRSGRTENGDLAAHTAPASTSTAVKRATGTRPSSLSNSPP